MNRYNRYPGDYMRDTMDLTMAEDGAYTRLMDAYYANEQPIDHERRFQVARAHTKTEKKITQWVLERFFRFEKSDENGSKGCWISDRIETEIGIAKHRIAVAQNNGGKGGRPPKKAPNADKEKPSGLANENPVGNPERKLPPPPPIYKSPPLPTVAPPQGAEPESPSDSPPKPTKKKTKPKRKWTRAPADFQPTDAHRALASELGVSLNAALAKFRDHEYRSPKTDADAAFRTWLRNTREFAGGGRRAPPVQRGVAPGAGPVTREYSNLDDEKEIPF